MNRNKLEIIYSIGVIIAIPVILIANTIIISQSTNQAFDLELRRKADLANSIIAKTSIDLIKNKDYDKLKQNLNELELSQPTLTQSAVIVNDNNNLKLVAYSSSAPDSFNRTGAKIAIDRKQSISTLVNTTDANYNQVQAWNVMTPILDSDNSVIAIISASFLTVDAQEAINSAYKTSFIVLIVSIILVMGLLFRHFRLVGYINLLAKQRELNQTMNDFLSVATHELKAPTTIIKGYLSNIMDGDYGMVNEPIKEPVNVALLQTDRLNSLVQDLLNVSRVEQGRIQYKLSTVDSVKILNTITTNYHSVAENKGLKLVYTPIADNNLIYADEGRVQEVFTNLIDNAIKYTATGSVTVTQQINKGFLITNFRDTGFGISPEAKERLFQRFYRVQTSQTQGISGTGLGLWIIKQYVTAMNGTIEVETMEGFGSNFIVKLPIATTSQQQNSLK